MTREFLRNKPVIYVKAARVWSGMARYRVGGIADVGTRSVGSACLYRPPRWLNRETTGFNNFGKYFAARHRSRIIVDSRNKAPRRLHADVTPAHEITDSF